MSRTATVKRFEEAYFYGLVANENAHKMGVVQKVKLTAAATATCENGDDYSAFPAICGDVYGYVRTVTPVSTALTISVGGGTEVSIAAGTPSNRGFAFDASDNLQGTVAITGGVAGIILEIVYVPQFTSSEYLGYGTDFSMPGVDEWAPIYDKGDLKHRKRIFNKEQTLTFNLAFLNFAAGMHQFANQESTFLLERKDNGGATTSEKIYIGQCFGKEPDFSETGGDTDSTSAYTGRYERWFSTEQTPA
ncbi:MAG: hypothetical protein PHG61_04400 [Candidatus Marinimicrobia bacterium]|nr:hypothetical protein [Candidatus Neomarinimicrobiota bacterium]